MPATWRVHVISERLRAENITAAVRERDLYALVDVERHAVLDVMIAHHADPPMVVVEGTVACFGDLDLDAVVRVAKEASARGGESF